MKDHADELLLAAVVVEQDLPLGDRVLVHDTLLSTMIIQISNLLSDNIVLNVSRNCKGKLKMRRPFSRPPNHFSGSHGHSRLPHGPDLLLRLTPSVIEQQIPGLLV